MSEINCWRLVVGKMEAIKPCEEVLELLKDQTKRTQLRALVAKSIHHSLKERVHLDTEIQKLFDESVLAKGMEPAKREALLVWFLQVIQEGYERIEDILADLLEHATVYKVATGYNPDLIYVFLKEAYPAN